MKSLTMRELMYAPVGGLAGLPPIEPDVDPLRVPDVIDESELMDVYNFNRFYRLRKN